MTNSILNCIGNTPLVKVPFGSKAIVYAKLEYLNPGGSIKDRSAKYMVEEAEQEGKLKPGGTIVEASSGNQAIALAMIGAMKGYKVIITAPKIISREKLTAITAYGAKVIVCPAVPFDDPRSYHSQADKILAETPNSFMPNQYKNLKNQEAHYKSLGPEIWKQTNGKITHFFAAAGTGGTVSGAGKFLKEQNPQVKVLAVDAATSFYATKGHPRPYAIESMGIDYDSPLLQNNFVDEFLTVKDEEAFGMLKTMAHKYGLLIGTSSGAVVFAANDYIKQLGKDAVVVMIFGDSGRAYLSKGYYS
ncbi:MAG: cysteine synthase family protein [Candidatus Doudnabacteria bacterium]|nr:cysteine synthase family protein [Candidatus Doudnabacteria bacterium]